jgi:hypothetical protein
MEFESPKFMHLVSIILGQKEVSAMELEAGSQEVPGLSYEIFHNFCEILYDAKKDKVEIRDDDQGYEFKELTYRGYRFCGIYDGDNPWYYCKRIRK